MTTNNVAEYTGLLEGLKAAVDIDPDAEIEARLDSKLVVEQMSGRWAIKNDTLRRIALQARDVVPRERVSFTWVPREKNKAADELANESMDAVERGRPGFDPPRRRRTPSRPRSTPTRCRPARGPRSSGWGPDIGAPTVTLIVRHGVTQHSVERRFSGSGGRFDPPLVAQGVAQAEAAAAEVASARGRRRARVLADAAHAPDRGADRRPRRPPSPSSSTVCRRATSASGTASPSPRS